MSYLVYISESCKNEAKTYGRLPAVETLAKKIEQDQKISWHYYKAPWFIRKKVGNDYRLIAKLIPLPDLEVTAVCFLKFYSKGDYELDSFDVTTIAITNLDEVQNRLRSRLQSGAIAECLAPPSDSESIFLNPTFQDRDPLDLLVYESHEWVRTIGEEWAKESFDTIHSLVDDICWNNDETLESGIKAKNNRYVVHRRVENPACIFLCGVTNNEAEAQKIQDKYRELVPRKIEDLDELRQLSRRTFPRIISADIDTWKNIEKDDAANLALSSEETRVLESISHHGESRYPLFINGRPGSGKSTILHYVFADLLSQYLRVAETSRTGSPPLYLTYSRNLLDVSIANIGKILRLNASRLGSGANVEDIGKEYDRIRDSCFKEFHLFLLGLLPDEDRHVFSTETRIDFSRFRQSYLAIRRNKKELARLAPEVVWHVVRSYIKGMCDEDGGYFDSNDYERFDTKRKTVTQETFDTIFIHAWEGWYKDYLLERSFWDDQDLTRKVLDSGYEFSKYPAVFCDEAQDFTPNEIELILRLSLFSKRRMQPYQLKSVPFAFAGDPFQTLNPTGFDWEKMRSSFHEKVIQELDKTDQSQLQFNYQELTFNYRSTKEIAGISNLIQLVRLVIFGKRSVRPQNSWNRNTLNAGIPTYFPSSDEKVFRQISEQTDLVIILPCQEGEEEAYINDDEQLKKLYKEGKNINILSAMAAKGQEFPRVVIYRFGDDCLHNVPRFAEILQQDINDGLSDIKDSSLEDMLGWEYFLNRLYVAVSRPKRELYIIDSSDAIDQFWKSSFLTKTDELLDVLHSRASEDSLWNADLINLPVPGTSIGGPGDSGQNDLLILATNFRDEGIATRSGYLLKLAANNFRNLERYENEARLCDANRFVLEEKPRDASEAYLSIDMIPEALECLWNAGMHEEIRRQKKFQDRKEFKVSDFLKSEFDWERCEGVLDTLIDALKAEDKHNLLNSKAWENAFWSVLAKIIDSSTKHETVERLFSRAEQIVQLWPGIQVKKELARLAFKARQFERVVNIWDELTEDRLNDYEYLVASYEVGQSSDLTPDYLRKVFSTYLRLGLFDRALGVAKRTNFEDQWNELYSKVRNSEECRHIAVEAAFGLLRNFVLQSNEKKVIDLLSEKHWQPEESANLLRKILFAEVTEQISNPSFLFQLVKRIVDGLDLVSLDDSNRIASVLDKSGALVETLKACESLLETEKLAEDSMDRIRRFWLETKLKQRQQAIESGRNSDLPKYESELAQKSLEWNLEDIISSVRPTFSSEPKENSKTLTSEQKDAAWALKKLGKTDNEIAQIIEVPVESITLFFVKGRRSRRSKK